MSRQFLSTLSLRRATVFKFLPVCAPVFLSTLSLRRATIFPLRYIRCCLPISIHALLAESDVWAFAVAATLAKFLSTLSLRRATRAQARLRCRRIDFYPRSPCGERPQFGVVFRVNGKFLSTLSLRRATGADDAEMPAIRKFLSTLSLRRATSAQFVGAESG